MKTIRLLYAANLIHRSDGTVRQELDFQFFVKSRTYEKLVEVHWAGSDGYWHVLPATFLSVVSSFGEIWRAHAAFTVSPGQEHQLPGDLTFALHSRIGGRDDWDNNNGTNHQVSVDSGVRLADDITVKQTDFQPNIPEHHNFLPITVATRLGDQASQVFVRWSTDRWRTYSDTPCFFWRKHWHAMIGSAAHNPNAYGTQIWVSHVAIADAFRVEYAIACETTAGTTWDNNFGQNYVARHAPLRVLTLNLHCNQEENQDAKLSLIAQVIRDHDIDVVCFQEVAEPWNDGHGDSSVNTAKTIRDRIGRPYHLHLDWSHQGFGQYRESCAILSRHEFVATDSCYVSNGRDVFDINTRKAVMVQIRVPYAGIVNVICAHLSWWDSGFCDQFMRLRQWIDSQQSTEGVATLLCGDFNAAANSAGYALMTEHGDFVDQFLAGGRAGRNSAGRTMTISENRIDYVLLRRGDRLTAVDSRELFTDTTYGRVSDHPGYLVEFEPK